MPESDGEVLNPNFRLSSFIRARHGPDEAIELPEPRPTPVDGYVYKAAVAKLGTLDSTDHHIVGCPVNAEVPVQLLHMCMYVCVYIYIYVCTYRYIYTYIWTIHTCKDIHAENEIRECQEGRECRRALDNDSGDTGSEDIYGDPC